VTTGSDGKNEITIDEMEIKRLNALHEHASKSKAMEMGRIGYWLGAPENAVLYLSVLILTLAGVGAFTLSYIDPSLRADVEKAFVAVATAAAGFMFGSISTRGGRRDNRN
jgi:hypothetical protein